MERVDRLRRELPSTRIRRLSPQLGSILLILALLILLVVLLLSRHHDLEVFSVLLGIVLAALCVVVFLFTRSLAVASEEQRQTASALVSTEREFQSVFENALDAILILDDQGICREANPSAARLFGARREELLGQAIERFYKRPGDFRGSWADFLARKSQQGDAELLREDQSTSFVEFTTKADYLPGRHVMILRDITQRRIAELALLESEGRFQQMASNIQEIFWMIDAGTKKALFVNQAYEKITGRSPQTLVENPTSYEELIHPEDRVRVLSKLDEATQTGDFDEKFRITRPDGKVRWLWVRGFPVRDAEGRIWRLVGTAQEVTALRQAEEDTTHNLVLAQSAWAEAEALRKATLALTQDLRMDYVMDALLRSLAELIPYTCARVLIPEGGPHVLALGEKLCPETTKTSSAYPLTLNADESPILQRILADQNSVLIPDTKQEKGWHTFKGHAQLRSWLSVPLVASNQYLGFLSVGHNDPNRFTQEHLRRAQLLAIPAAAAIQNARLYERAEIYGSELERRLIDLDATQKALALSEGDRRISEEKFQKVFRSSPVAFSITTVDEGRFLDANTAFENRHGYSHSDLIGHTVHELGIWEDPADRTFLIAQLRRGGPVRNVITRLRTKSGEIKLTAYSADRIQFDGQACILAVSQDVPQYDAHRSN
jgi:PAS domain S-box-containing protein